VLYPALGIMGTREAAPNYTDQLVFLFLGGFLIAAAMTKWNLHKRIALHTIRIFGAGPRRMILGFMVATAFLSMWISNTATVLMMLPIAMAVVRKLSEGALYQGEAGEGSEQRMRHSFGVAMMLGIAYSASVGGIGTLIGTPPNGVFVGQLARNYAGDTPEVAFSQWMIAAMPVVLVMIPIVWLVVIRFAPYRSLAHFVFGSGARGVIDDELAKLGPMGRAERKVAVVFALTAFLWMFRRPIELGFATIPGWGPLYGLAHLWSDSTIALMMGLTLFMLPADLKNFNFAQGRRRNFVLDWRTAQDGVPWGILLLFGGGFALAHGFSASGLSLWIGEHLRFLGGMPILLVVMVIAMMMTFLTEMTSNTATTTLMMPILAVAALDLVQHPFLLMLPATMSASCAFMLPVATPPNAIVFGTGWVTVPRMSRTGLLLNFIGIAVVTAVVLIVATQVFGIEFGTIPDWATQLKGEAVQRVVGQ
jgi:sodium-dependent dicarboxylate transporter 2/3/5